MKKIILTALLVGSAAFAFAGNVSVNLGGSEFRSEAPGTERTSGFPSGRRFTIRPLWR